MLQRIITLFISLFFICQSPLLSRRNDGTSGGTKSAVDKANKTLTNRTLGSLDGYSERITKKPVLEILYAWLGYDQWEAVSGVAQKDKWDDFSNLVATPQALANAPTNVVDVTTIVRAALNNGGLYISRNPEPMLVKGGYPTDPSTSNAYCMGPQITGDNESISRGIVNPTSHTTASAEQAATAAARAAIATPAQISGIRTTQRSALALTDKTVGIIYRDIDGIHFRRFEGWQNISLPMINSLKILDQNFSNGAFYYHHQFEEIGRGLITFTAKGASALRIMALDRFGWGNTHYVNNTLYPGVLHPLYSYGPDFRLMHPTQKDLPHDFDRRWFNAGEVASSGTTTTPDQFEFLWSSNSSINLKPGGYGLNWFDTKNPSYSTIAYQWYYNRFQTLTKERVNQYKYYDANNAIQSLACGSNIDPTINTTGANKLLYPGAIGTEANLWFAFDRTTSGMNFMVGTGQPKSEADWITPGTTSNAPRLLYQQTVGVSPFLRNFGFRSDLNAGDGYTARPDSDIRITNIESYPLNPGTKFCVPPYSKNKFLFWRKEWTLPAPDFFSLKFKARGDTIQIAFGAKTYAQRMATPTFDTGFTYSIGVTSGEVTVQKMIGNTPAPTASQPTVTRLSTNLLGGSDKETFYSYWITYANGTFEIGTGDTIGQSIVARAIDSAPTNTSTSFCFSSDIRPTDYINITADQYQSITDTSTKATEELGTYVQWPTAQTFSTPGRGALLLSYKDANDTSPIVMVGLTANPPAPATPGQPAPNITPDYQVILGTQNNTAGEIRKQSSTVQLNQLGAQSDGTAINAITADGQWHDIWIIYNNGTIAYGNGNRLGASLIGYWQDTNPIANIKAFAFTSPSPNMQIRLSSIPPLDEQSTHAANPGIAPVTKPLWQSVTPHRGALTMTATGTNGIIEVGLQTLSQTITDSPRYQIIIGENNTAYIKKDTVKQSNSIVTLTPAQLPTATGTQYWLAWRDGVLLVGTGSNPLDQNSKLLQWQDTGFNQSAPGISKFTLSASAQRINYSGVGIVDFAPYETAFTTTAGTIAVQTTTQTAWQSNPTQLELTPALAQSLYWHQTVAFTQPGSTGFSYSVQKKSTAPLDLYIGFSDALPANTSVTQLNGARFYLTVSDTGTVTAKNSTGATIATLAGSHDLFKRINDNAAHTIWVTATTITPATTTIAVGIDSKIGVNPLISGTLPTGAVILNYIGIGANAATASIREIASAPFSDPTRCTTSDAGIFTWQDTWSFSTTDQEQIGFTVTALNQPAKPLSLAIGLGLESATTPPSPTQFNSAEYVVLIDFTGQISLLKKPNYGTKLGSVRYIDQNDTAKHALVQSLTSGTACRCTLGYDAGRFQLIIGDSTVVWDYTDTTPTPNIKRFSFSSIQSNAQITDISNRGGQSLRSIEQIFNLLTTTIATNPSAVITQLQEVITNRLIAGKEAYFLIAPTSVVNTILAHKELFSDAERTQLASLLNDASFGLAATHRPSIQQAIANITTPLNWVSLATEYKTQIPALFGNGTATATVVPAEAPARRLFISKITKLGGLPDALLNSAGVLPAIQELVTAFTPITPVLTATEQAAVKKLEELGDNARILSNFQDPESILDLGLKLISSAQQMSALKGLITARYNSSARIANAPIVAPFTAQQNQKIMTLLKAIIDNRDELNSDELKEANLLLQTCRVIPELRSETTGADATKIPATPGLSINDLTTILATPVTVADQLKKLQSRIADILIKPSTDQARQLFFQYLNRFITSPADKNADILTALTTTIISQLQSIPLNSDETAIVTAANAMITAATTTNKSFAAQLQKAQETAATLNEYIAFLATAIQSKGINTVFAEEDFKTLVNTIEYIVDSRELLTTTDPLTNLIRTAQLLPQMSSYKDALNGLLAEATSAYPFNERIAYLKTEIASVIARRQANPTATTPDYFYLRMIQKLGVITAAPGVKTELLFNELQASIIDPLIAISTDQKIIEQLQAIRNTIITTKQEVIAQQTKFAYHFAAAQEHKANTSVYISMLKGIIENERTGVITFTGNDTTTFISALTEMVAARDALTANDITTLATAINYALYSETYKSLPAAVKTLTDLYTQVNTPLSFSDRVTSYKAKLSSIIRLLPTNTERIAYFKTLNTLFDAPGERTTAIITVLQNDILTLLSASPLSDSEKATVQALQTVVVNTQQNNKTATYQLNQLMTLPNLADIATGLTDLLKRKGISVIFTTEDFETVLNQIKYLVDNRELLQPSSTSKDTTAINALSTLIRTALLLPELNKNKDDLNELLTKATTQQTFTDRVTYAKTEIEQLIQLHTANPDMDLNYRYNRMISKLTIILDAPGMKTEELFNLLDTRVITPLTQLATSESQQKSLQSIITTIMSSKSSILAQQNTFGYHFAAAQEQKDNLSTYVSMLKGIIENERKGNISFDSTQNDPQTFIAALSSVLEKRDLLSASDLTILIGTINFALFSKTYANNQTYVKTLEQLLTYTATPIPFADRITTYSKQTTSVLSLPETDTQRINFFTGLSSLLDAPGLKTPSSIELLQKTIITPLTASPLSPKESAILNNLKDFLVDAQKQVQSASYQIEQLQSSDWNSYITGLQNMLTQKGLSFEFTKQDFNLYLEQLRYIVNNRELLQSGSNTSLLTRSADTLLRTAQLAPELADQKAEIGQLIIELNTPHTFTDRIAYTKSEIVKLLQMNQASSQTSLEYWFDRIITKLSSITNAPGIKTEDLFNDIEISIINPLLRLIKDDGRRQTIQNIRSTLATNKATIIEAQKTFQYHYEAAQEQKQNTSVYITLLRDIIGDERKGTITFDTAKIPSDAETFVKALSDIVEQRDGFTDNDNKVVATAINYALFSNTFANNPTLKTTLQTLLTTINTPISFADRITNYSAKTRAILALTPATQDRITFFKNLQSLIDAPGIRTAESIAQLTTAIITPCTASPLSEDEQVIIKNLENFITAAQNNIRSVAYQITTLQSEEDLAAYITGLQDVLSRKGTYFTFAKDDYKLFVDELKYIVNSRELLNGSSLIAAQELVSNTLLSAEFAEFNNELTLLSQQIKLPFYFNDRITWMTTEIQKIASRTPSANDAMLKRFIIKLGYLIEAPQQNTTDTQFNNLETRVIAPLARLALNDEQKKTIESIRANIRTAKAQILLSQTTFKYYFDLAQTQKDNLDTYITILRDAMIRQRDGSVNFSGTDSANLLSALTTLVNNRDELTSAQNTLLKTLLNYCIYSTVYKGTADAARLDNLYQQISKPVALTTMIQKYSTTLESILFLPSTNPKRILFFNQLSNISNSTEVLTPTLANQLNTTIINRLADTPLSFTEQAVIKKLQDFTSATERNAQSVSFLLQVADDSNTDLFNYAQAVTAIIQQKGISLTFSADDDLKIIAALTYIVASRELLTAPQIKSLQQLLSQIIWLGAFASYSDQLKALLTDLGTAHLFTNRVTYAANELRAMVINKTAATSNRMLRLISKLDTILDATGPSTPEDFDTLQNTITQMQLLALPEEQKPIVKRIMDKIVANRDSILAAQKTFSYNFTKAQAIQDNITNYINALQNIITLRRQELMTFEPADYRTFINALLVISDQRDAMSASDLEALKTTLNYTYYCPGFTDAQYQKELTGIYATLNTPVSFMLRVNQYIAALPSIMKLDSSALERQRFFNKLKLVPNLDGSSLISDIEILVSKIITPLQTIPLNKNEQSIISELLEYVTTIRQQASTFAYNIKLVTDAIVAASTDTTKNTVDIMINGLNDVIVKRNAGSITLTGADFQQLVSIVSDLIDNRELFTNEQINRVQALIKAIQFGPGFESFKATLDTLYTTVTTPLTFAQRITKYRTSLPGMNSNAIDDPSKNQFVNMVISIMAAPGERTLELINSLETDVLNPIKFGNFTEQQKLKIDPVLTAANNERYRLRTFSYRLSMAQQLPTPREYLQALTQMITDITAGTLTLTTLESAGLMSELEKQVTMRPLVPTTESEIYALIALVKGTPPFSTRSDLVAKITQLTTTLGLPVDIAARVAYFTQQTMSMLGKPVDSGERQQFFGHLTNFATELASVPVATINAPASRTALSQLSTAMKQYQISSLATEGEKIIFTGLIRQLEDTTVNTPTAQLATTTLPTMPAATSVTSTNNALPRSSASSRFFRAVPASRYAQ